LLIVESIDPPVLITDAIPDYSEPLPLDHSWDWVDSYFDATFNIQAVPDTYLGFSAIWFIDP